MDTVKNKVQNGKTIVNSTKIDVKRSEIRYDLTHLQHDSIHCLAKGLFRSLGPGDRKHLRLDVTYTFGKKQKIEFNGPYALGADDLRVLQGLVAIAPVCNDNKTGYLIRKEAKGEIAKLLRQKLELKQDAIDKDIVMIKTSYRRLMREIGYKTTNIEIVKDSLKRLYEIAVFFVHDKQELGSHLLSFYASENKGQLCVALNPLLTNAILGKGHYVRIDMNEVRAIQSDPARLIHQHLCAVINFGTAKRISIDTLCEYVWPDKTENIKTLWKRQNTVRKALQEIAGLGWEIKEYSKNKFEIKRPKTVITVKQKKSKKKAK